MYTLYNKTKIEKLRTDLKECEIINQSKNDENFTSLINAGPRLNASFKQTPGLWGQVLNKRRGRLTEKTR